MAKIKKKTSVNIDAELWKEWSKFVIDKTSSARKIGEELENALKEYMNRHKGEEMKSKGVDVS